MFAISSRTLHSESDDDGKPLGQVNDASCLQNAASTNQPPPPILKTKRIFLVLFSFPANQLRPFLAAKGTMLHPSRHSIFKPRTELHRQIPVRNPFSRKRRSMPASEDCVFLE
jgi:hypothetical protein